MFEEPKKKRRYYNVSPTDFVRAWQESESIQEVADKLGMSRENVCSRASAYRTRGVNLKLIKRSPRKLDVEGLNTL